MQVVRCTPAESVGALVCARQQSHSTQPGRRLSGATVDSCPPFKSWHTVKALTTSFDLRAEHLVGVAVRRVVPVDIEK